VAIPETELMAEPAADPAYSAAERTPGELRALQARLGRRAIDTNLAILEMNARLAARLAVALAARQNPAEAVRG
jgi:pseudouridine-5'-phosphate glycosidase